MKRKGAGKKRLMMVALVVFASTGFLSTGVMGEGKYFDGYSNTENQSGYYHSDDESDSGLREVDNAKPALAMTTELKLDKPLGAYLRFGVVSDKGVFPYFVTGVTRWTRSDLEAASNNSSDSDGDISYGIGADFNVAEDAKINVEYIDYIDGAEMETSGFSFGASWTF